MRFGEVVFFSAENARCPRDSSFERDQSACGAQKMAAWDRGCHGKARWGADLDVESQSVGIDVSPGEEVYPERDPFAKPEPKDSGEW